MDISAWAPLLEDAGPESHVALVYRDHAFLAQAVAAWSEPVLRAGGGVILVGTAAHAMSIRTELQRSGVDVDAAERLGRLVIVDADWLMGHFILDGTPHGDKFRVLATEIIEGVRRAAGNDIANVRAWGEMVSLLRLRGNPSAARRLEELWTSVITEQRIALLCSYDLEVRPSADHAQFLSDVAGSHDGVLLQPESFERGAAMQPS